VAACTGRGASILCKPFSMTLTGYVATE